MGLSVEVVREKAVYCDVIVESFPSIGSLHEQQNVIK